MVTMLAGPMPVWMKTVGSPLRSGNWIRSSPFLWVRCHANAAGLGGNVSPAVQLSFPAAWTLYANGVPIGTSGDLSSGYFPTLLFGPFPSRRRNRRATGPGLTLRDPRCVRRSPSATHDWPRFRAQRTPRRPHPGRHSLLCLFIHLLRSNLCRRIRPVRPMDHRSRTPRAPLPWPVLHCELS